MLNTSQEPNDFSSKRTNFSQLLSLPGPVTFENLNDSNRKDSSLCNLTFDQFLQLDPNKLNIHLINTVNDSLFLNDSKEHKIQIEIAGIPCLEITRSFQEITAFCNILDFKFPEVKWSPRPQEYQTLKSQDIWKKEIEQTLEKVLELIRANGGHRNTLLCVLYAFLISNEASEQMRKHLESPTNKLEIRHSRSWSEGQIDPCSDKLKIILQNFINEMEKKMQIMQEEKNREQIEVINCQTKHQEPNKDNQSNKEANLSPKAQKKEDKLEDQNETPKRHKKVLDQNSGDKICDKHKTVVVNSLSELPSTSQLLKDTAKKGEDLNSSLQSEKKTPKGKHGNKFIDFLNKTFSKKNKETSKQANKEKPLKADPSTELPLEEKKELSIIPLIQNLADTSIWKDITEDSAKDPSEMDILTERDTDELHEREKQRDNYKSPRSDDSWKSSSTYDMSKLIKKEIPNFVGYLYMKLSCESIWNRYFAKLSHSCLLLYHNSTDADPVHIIPCFRITINYVDTEERDYIVILELYHKFDAERIEILMDPNSKVQNDSTDPFKNLRMWYVQLKIVTQKTEGLKIPFHNYYPIGKIQLTVSEATNIKGLPNNSSCYVRIFHIPYTLQTCKIHSSELMNWKQSFFIPLCESFLPIKIEVICVSHEGWLKESKKEEIICTGEILVSNIISIRSNSAFNVPINFQYTETKRKHIAKVLNIPEGELPQPQIKFKIKDLSSFKVLFGRGYGDYVEGVHMDPEKYVKQHFKLSIRRVKRIIRYIKLFYSDIQSIFRYKYPFFSYFCILLFSYIITVTEIENLLSNIVLFLVLLSIYKHPSVESKIKPILVDFFFKDEYRNPFYCVPRVTTVEEVTTQKDLNTEKWKYKLVDENNLVTQILVIKRVLTGLTIGLTKIAGFFEKFKNIILWKEPSRTIIFIGFGLLLYCLLATLPLRWTLLSIVWLNFIQGIGYYKHLKIRNEEVAKSTINFILKRSFPAYSQQIWKKPHANWPSALNVINFQKKMIDQLNFRLGVVLPDDALSTFKSPHDLVTALATCSKPLKFKTSPVEKANLGMVRWKDPSFNAKSLLNFIMNAPSDYFRVTHPQVIHPEIPEHDTEPSLENENAQ